MYAKMLSNSILHAHIPKKATFLRFRVFWGSFGAAMARKQVKNQFWAKQKNIPLEIPLRNFKKYNEL
jgi:hypothetical protein